MKNDDSQRAFLGSIHQYAGAFFIYIFAFLASLYIIRKLTVNDFGIYNFVIVLITTAQFLTSLGLEPAIIRYLPEFKEKKNHYVLKRIVLIPMLLRFFAVFIFIFIMLSMNSWISSTFNLPPFFNKLLLPVSLIILLALESQLLGDAALVSLFENRYWNYSKIIYSLLKFILFYFSLSLGYGIWGILWSWLFVELVLFSMFLIKAYEVIFLLPTKKEDEKQFPLTRLIRFSRYLVFQQGIWLFRDKAADIFLLSYFLGTYEVGLYSFAFGIPLMMMSFSPGSILRGILTPLFVRSYIRNRDTQQLSYFFELVNKIIFFTMVPFFTILIILADKVIEHVFNPAYLEVTGLFVISLLFVMVQQFAYSYSAIIYTLEKTKIHFVASLFAFYNLIMDLILIPMLGILGAILATGSAGVLVLIYYHWALEKEGLIKLKYPWKSFGYFTINTLLTALLALLGKYFINSLFSLACILTFCFLFYLIFSYINKGFDQRDRDTFNHAIGRSLWIF
ncbi:oligosaccharide flippase family protein [Thermodesulfobacteriota bacterium]